MIYDLCVALTALTLATSLLCSGVLITSLYTTLLDLLKSTGTVFSLSLSILPTSTFKLAKYNFAAKPDILKPFFVFLLLFQFETLFDFYFAIRFHKTLQQFRFFNHKDFFISIRSITFSKNVFKSSYYHIVSNFKLRIFIFVFGTKINVCFIFTVV